MGCSSVGCDSQIVELVDRPKVHAGGGPYLLIHRIQGSMKNKLVQVHALGLQRQTESEHDVWADRLAAVLYLSTISFWS